MTRTACGSGGRGRPYRWLSPVQAARRLDMSVPDALGWLRAGVPTFTRHSDVEPYPPYYESTQPRAFPNGFVADHPRW